MLGTGPTEHLDRFDTEKSDLGVLVVARLLRAQEIYLVVGRSAWNRIPDMVWKVDATKKPAGGERWLGR